LTPSVTFTQRVPRLVIVNVVCTADLKQFIDLETLAHCRGFQYSTSIYRGRCAYLKDKETEGKVTIFATGKMISIGSRAYSAAKRDLHYAATRLEHSGLISRARMQVKLRNIVATAMLREEINLETLSSNIPHVIYEPEQFPAAIYFATELDGASILIFSNGKLVFAGLKTKEHMTAARKVVENLVETLSGIRTRELIERNE
jgi:TATA-box binding protein (TBP) (component of TFIID and TFIIIB)